MTEPTPSETALSAALNGAYRERNAVVAALIRSNGWPAEVVNAPDTEGWWIVYAETPAGQVSWHIAPEDMDLFSDWPVAFGSHHSPWDGHTTEEKYRRLATLDAERASRSATEGRRSVTEQLIAELVGVESSLDQARERLRKAIALGPSAAALAPSEPEAPGLPDSPKSL